jgi:hypothetical protein
MRYFLFFFLAGCSLLTPKPSNELAEISERAMKQKEGVDIRITPVDQEKK